MRVLIVDDEPLARRGIRARLERIPEVEILDECQDGAAAVTAIRELGPDLVFLDVQMPELDGFGVIGAITPELMPVTILVTAYDEHALRAFEAHALDYLLKPIDDERFERAVARARTWIEQARTSDLGRRLSGLVAEFSASTSPALGPARHGYSNSVSQVRFLARSAGRIVVIPATEIDWVEASGNYVSLHSGKAAHMVRETMAEIEKKLDPARFVRIHRSTIVNIERIRSLEPYFNREFIIVLQDGTKLKLSRSHRDRLDALLNPTS